MDEHQGSLDVQEWTIADTLYGYIGSRFSVQDVTRAYKDRIGRLNSTLNAITVVAKDAIEQAQKLDEAFKKTGKLVGPLHGIPIVIKDQIETAGM
ncbi:hypothetical protein LTR28_000372, partial [Elasticomyces elasticus]